MPNDSLFISTVYICAFKHNLSVNKCIFGTQCLKTSEVGQVFSMKTGLNNRLCFSIGKNVKKELFV